MKSYLLLNNEKPPLPPDVSGPDIRYTDALVRHFLTEFTQEGDTIFDPFAASKPGPFDCRRCSASCYDVSAAICSLDVFAAVLWARATPRIP